MSMKDLLSKMTELQGTTKETKEEKVTSTGKKLLNENTEVKESTKPSLKNIFNTMLNEAERVDEKYMGFEKVKAAAEKGGAEDSGAVAASIGRKKYGKEKFQKAAAAGKKLGEAEQITIQPAKQNTQVIKQGQKTLGTVENPQLAQQIAQATKDGKLTLNDPTKPQMGSQGAGVQEDNLGEGLDSDQRQRLTDLIDVYRDATDPEGYSDEDPEEIVNQIRSEFGDKIADTVSQGPSMHYPRPGHVSGVYDPLANKSSPRITKSGKINKQDAENMKRTIKHQHGMYESKLTEKAVSKSQQQAAGIALAAKKGEMPKSKLKGASKEMAKMPTKELEKFAGTKHKGLPEKKQKTDEALEKDGPNKGDLNFKVPTTEKGREYTASKAKQRADMNKKNDPGAAKKGLALSVVDREKADKKAKLKNTNEAAMPTHDGDFGAGLGAGRSETTLESSTMRLVKQNTSGTKSYKLYKDQEWGEFRVKFYENGKHLTKADYHTDDKQDAIDTAEHFLTKSVSEAKKSKPDFLDLDKDGNKKESMKKAAADKQKGSTMKKTTESKAKPDYIDLDKDGNKKEPMKKAAADAKTKKKVAVKEGANPTEAARLLGKAHALAKDPYACKYESGTPEAQAYLDGYKEGLDDCYGSGGMSDSGMGSMSGAAIMPGIDSMVSSDSMMDSPSPRGGSEFEFGGFDDVSDDDMMAFESWDRELNALLNEGKMKDIDIDMKEMSDAQFKKEHGKSKADMKKDLSASKDKKVVKEGISVSVSKGNQGTPDSVTVTAQDGEADQLLAMIKQAGLGLFGGEETSGYGAPTTPQMPTSNSDVGDHDSMMALIKKMSTSPNDYEDEESQDDEHVHGHPDAACDVCGSSDCGCDDESDSKALVVGEDETEDQMGFMATEDNAPDSDEAETSADENAEAKEDQALAGAMSGDEEEINEDESSYPTINGKQVDINSIEIDGGSYGDSSDVYVTRASFVDGTELNDRELDELSQDSQLMSDLQMGSPLNEWANDAGYEGSENIKDNTFEQDIDFMTRVISGGLNGPKKDQTTLPHTKVKVAENNLLNDWKKLSGIK